MQTKQGPVWQERLQHQKKSKPQISCTYIECHSLPTPSRPELTVGCSSQLLRIRCLTAHHTLRWALRNVPRAVYKVCSTTRNCSYSSQALGQAFEAWVHFQRAMAPLGCRRPALWSWYVNMASQGMSWCLKRGKEMSTSTCAFKIVPKLFFFLGGEEGHSCPSHTPQFLPLYTVLVIKAKHCVLKVLHCG